MSIKDEMNENHKVEEWTRTTVADGEWQNTFTIKPLKERDDFLADKIDNLEINLGNKTISGGTGINVSIQGDTTTISTNDNIADKVYVDNQINAAIGGISIPAAGNFINDNNNVFDVNASTEPAENKDETIATQQYVDNAINEIPIVNTLSAGDYITIDEDNNINVNASDVDNDGYIATQTYVKNFLVNNESLLSKHYEARIGFSESTPPKTIEFINTVPASNEDYDCSGNSGYYGFKIATITRNYYYGGGFDLELNLNYLFGGYNEVTQRKYNTKLKISSYDKYFFLQNYNNVWDDRITIGYTLDNYDTIGETDNHYYKTINIFIKPRIHDGKTVVPDTSKFSKIDYNVCSYFNLTGTTQDGTEPLLVNLDLNPSFINVKGCSKDETTNTNTMYYPTENDSEKYLAINQFLMGNRNLKEYDTYKYDSEQHKNIPTDDYQILKYTRVSDDETNEASQKYFDINGSTSYLNKDYVVKYCSFQNQMDYIGEAEGQL